MVLRQTLTGFYVSFLQAEAIENLKMVEVSARSISSKETGGCGGSAAVIFHPADSGHIAMTRYYAPGGVPISC